MKDAEREEAEKRFGGKPAPAPSSVAGGGGGGKKSSGEGGEEEASIRKGPTPEQVMAIKAAIANASTLEEVKKLEEALMAGGGGDAMEEG